MGISKRNGKVEALRFVFAIAVLLFHVCKYIFGLPACGKGALSLTLFVNGAIGVEFFFLVSGFLMAKAACRIREKPALSIGGETWTFIFKKYKSLWFYHIVAWGLTFVTYYLMEGNGIGDIVAFFIRGLPSLFMLQLSGLKGLWMNHTEWYLSVMMIGMFLLYPFILKFGRTFTRVAVPLIGLLVVGYLSHTTGSLTGVTVWTGVAYKSMFRGIAELCLGAAAFELCEFINSKSLTRCQRVWLTVLEFVCYAGVLLFAVFTVSHEYEVYVLGFLFVGVSLSFSGATYGAGALSRPAVYWLGEMALPIYLAQVPVINCVTTYGQDLPKTTQAWVTTVGVLALALAFYGLKWLWTVCWRKRSEKRSVA